MLRISDIAEGLRLDRRTVQHWVDSGILNPPGKSHRRSFPKEFSTENANLDNIETNIACVLRPLARYRFPVRVLKRFAGAIRDAISVLEEPRGGFVTQLDIRRVFTRAAVGEPAWLFFSFDNDELPEGHEKIYIEAVFDEAQLPKATDRMAAKDGCFVVINMAVQYRWFRKMVDREAPE